MDEIIFLLPSPPSPVKIVGLYEDGVVAVTSDPNVTFTNLKHKQSTSHIVVPFKSQKSVVFYIHIFLIYIVNSLHILILSFLFFTFIFTII